METPKIETEGSREGGKNGGEGVEIVHKKRPWVMQKRGDKAGECWRISTRTKLGNVLLQHQLINSIRAKDKLWSCQVLTFFFWWFWRIWTFKKGIRLNPVIASYRDCTHQTGVFPLSPRIMKGHWIWLGVTASYFLLFETFSSHSGRSEAAV